VNGRQKDEAGNWTDKPNFFDVKVFGNQAEMLSMHLAKGRRIGVDGRLDWSSWEAQDGSKRSKVEVVASSVQFLDSRGDAEAGGQREYVPQGDVNADQSDFAPAGGADDDIPF
jgi:single-strand DNA-binding protein